MEHYFIGKSGRSAADQIGRDLDSLRKEGKLSPLIDSRKQKEIVDKANEIFGRTYKFKQKKFEEKVINPFRDKRRTKILNEALDIKDRSSKIDEEYLYRRKFAEVSGGGKGLKTAVKAAKFEVPETFAERHSKLGSKGSSGGFLEKMKAKREEKIEDLKSVGRQKFEVSSVGNPRDSARSRTMNKDAKAGSSQYGIVDKGNNGGSLSGGKSSREPNHGSFNNLSLR